MKTETEVKILLVEKYKKHGKLRRLLEEEEKGDNDLDIIKQVTLDLQCSKIEINLLHKILENEN